MNCHSKHARGVHYTPCDDSAVDCLPMYSASVFSIKTASGDSGHCEHQPMNLINCIGCGGQFPEVDGPTHRYMESVPGCWACYGEVLSREYSDPHYRSVHRLTVDAYAIQHPGQPSAQSIRSVALHAISLCAIFEDGVDFDHATHIIQRAAAGKNRFQWLTPPSCMGSMTIADVYEARTANEHAQLVRQWAQCAWSAWATHHAIFRRWLSEVWSP